MITILENASVIIGTEESIGNRCCSERNYSVIKWDVWAEYFIKSRQNIIAESQIHGVELTERENIS